MMSLNVTLNVCEPTGVSAVVTFGSGDVQVVTAPTRVQVCTIGKGVPLTYSTLVHWLAVAGVVPVAASNRTVAACA